MRKYRNYSDQDIIDKAKEVKSLAGLLRALDLREAGGNFANMRRLLQKLKVDTSHWTGQGWNKDKQLKDWSDYTRAGYLKPHLIKQRGHKCEDCLSENWKDHPIPLEIHHKDGDRTNNEVDNLQLLCCNCHALTDTYRNRRKPLKTV